MENRFGIKDFFLFSLILFLIGLSILSMVQVDRQWQSIQVLQDQSQQHTRDLIDIRRSLAEGVSVTNASPSTHPATTNPSQANGQWPDPFKPLKDAEAMPGFSRGDWLVENLRAKMKALTPAIGNDLYSRYIQRRVMEGLIYRDSDSLEFIPLLAKSWEFSPDGKTITFYLRKGITFSDGLPFTADDVVFTFDFLRNPVVNAARERSQFDLLKDVKKVDDYAVQFTFSKYYFKSLEVVGNQEIYAKHFYEKYTPEKFNDSTGLLIGTGPYRMATPDGWSPGQPIVLYRNDRYWGETPAPDRLVFLEVEEETADQTLFANGEEDIFVCTPEQYIKLKADPKVLEHAVPRDYVNMLGGYFYIAWNQKSNNANTIFADKRVRQAMTMLIDRQAICDNIYLGYASVPNGPFAPGSKQADGDLKPWPYDPERAKKLLAEAGIFDRDGDGVLDTPDGKPFTFKLTIFNKSAEIDRVTLFMKDGFAKAGVVMERDPVDWPVLQKKLDHREFEAVFLGWSGDIDEDQFQIFHSSQIADQGDDFMSYKNPECDAAIEAARTCMDPVERNELWKKVHRIIADDCPYTFLANRRVTVFFDKRWQNVRRSKISLNNVHTDYSPIPWFVPKAQQKYK
ncbi:MAG TPA: ABC transporter substrate-binding protein [Tepidisphaeraceae bacterium]|nr:ABC transporter substrate-binding protein [Tepidisphaeraceae bacterium]